MAVNEFRYEDFLATARSRFTQQFFDKPIFDKFVQLLIKDQQDQQDVLRDLMQARSLDTAVGKQLDILGDIVGYSRIDVTQELFKYFGFDGGPNSGTYGSLTDASVGSPWYSLGDPLARARQASDAEYRLILKSKIVKNVSSATPEEVINAYRFLFGAGMVTLEEYSPMRVRIGIGKILSPVEKGLLFQLGNIPSLLPKPLGVEYTYTEFTAGRVLATEGYPGGMGWGDLYDDSVGGILSNIFNPV